MAGNINKKLYEKARNDIAPEHFNVTIDGYSMIMEELTPNEAFNRRETIRHNILGGTQSVMRGNYLPRDYTFTTHLIVSPNNPDIYDSVFREWQSKPVTVNSKYMGGSFSAEVIIKKSPSGMPNYLNLEVQVIEIPTQDSLIPNEKIIIPTKPKSSVVVVSSNSSKKSTSKKTTNKKKNTKSKKKGKNITKTKSSTKTNSKSKKNK